MVELYTCDIQTHVYTYGTHVYANVTHTYTYLRARQVHARIHTCIYIHAGMHTGMSVYCKLSLLTTVVQRLKLNCVV